MHHKTHKINLLDLPSWYIYKRKHIKLMKNFENELNHSEQYFHVLTLITLPKNSDVIIF